LTVAHPFAGIASRFRMRPVCHLHASHGDDLPHIDNEAVLGEERLGREAHVGEQLAKPPVSR
jgi:hypothetical protein